MARVNFFSSPIGLGHITRDIAICDELRDVSASFVTGGGAAKILKMMEMPVHDVYDPPSFAVRNGTLRSPARWLWQYYRYYRDCKNISRDIIGRDSPDAIVSDEDFASLTVTQEKKIPTVLVTDILETRFTRGLASLVEKRMNRSMKEIIRRCDAVILPETGDDQDNMHRVGPIVRQTKHTREQLRERFSFDRKTIVISVGGTDAGLFLIEKVMEAIPKTGQDVETVLVAGPSVGKTYKNARNMGFVDNLHEIIYAADALISLAGKSTIDEANAYGTPAIFIPIRGHFEQEDNAREQGFAFEDITRLDELIPAKLEEKRSPADTQGAKRAARIIQSLIDSR